MNTKIGIVTLYGNFNFGNRLQNFALKYILESLGFDVDTTIVRHSEETSFKVRTKNKLRIIYDFLFRNDYFNRNSKFKSFSKKFLNEKFFYLNNKNDIIKIAGYNYFITGSDQVWNPKYEEYLPIYFLEFTPPEKRLSYAASISRDNIPDYLLNQYELWLDGMKCISVREQKAQILVRELVSRDVNVHLDPTLLLTKKEWLSFSKSVDTKKEKDYILTYFLGEPDEISKKIIKKIMLEKKLEVIELNNPEDKLYGRIGPREFLDLIDNAFIFFTDSFHGVCFSIVLETNFYVSERINTEPSMYSRIETLLKTFDLLDRQSVFFDSQNINVNFDLTKKILLREKEKSIKFLLENIK